MLKYILKIFDSWKKLEDIEELKEVVSPLSIHNTTGFPILVEKPSTSNVP